MRKDDILNCPLFKVPMDEQKHIVGKIDLLRQMTENLVAIYERKIQDLNELKKTFLQKAFSGELTANEPALSNV